MILENYCENVEVVGEAESAVKGAVMITKLNPDLIFSDIEMPGGNGFSLLEALESVKAKIVLVTAHANYMKKAFKFNVFDYLVKPIDIEEFQNTIERVRKSIESEVPSEQVEIDSESTKMALPTSTGRLYIDYSEIVQISAQGSYSDVKLQSGKLILVSKNLKYFESAMNKRTFMRIHRSCIVNLTFIREFSKSERGKVILTNNDELPVSNENKEELLERLSRL